MILLELKKLKRTGYLPSFLGGALLTSAIPAVNMAVRAETFTGLSESPFHILMDANWQLMAQLTILLIVCGCSLMYHTEYADRGDLKMSTLPVRQTSLFLSKFKVTLLSTFLVLAAQGISLTLCVLYWWPGQVPDFMETLKSMGYELFLLLPAAMLMLTAASACQNLWVSLGAGVILTFAGSMIPAKNEVLSLLPFTAPYRMLHNASPGDVPVHLAFCGAEILLFFLVELIYLHYRRS